MMVDHYTYVARFTNLLPAGPPQSFDVLIDEDAAFDLRALSFFAYGNAVQTESTRLMPNVLVSWNTQDSRRFTSQPVPLPALFGDGQNVFVLPRARRFSRRTQITFEAQNAEVATTINSLYLLLIGEKVFREQG
jgi:hypothetical protein